MTSMSSTPSRVAIRYEVPRSSPDWTLPEVPVPESVLHDQTVLLVQQLLAAWVERMRVSAQVARNLAVRWDEQRPKVGIDPDVCVIEPRTPEGDELTSLCTWKSGHAPPKLAIEVVSAGHPYKDYAEAPEKYAACGIEELWIFDPKLEGPKRAGGPHRIQVWRRVGDEFVREYAGPGPAWSEAVKAWLVATAEGERLRISDDDAGTRWWRTSDEEARARVEELEAQLREERGRRG
jgi:Uma2 family endonuclease